MLRTTELDDMNTPYRHTVKSRARAHTHAHQQQTTGSGR
uniref:Uncharacterized protein n=1 Tax=Anguilla anguilla TaxID=7936 RepID=A0A0E9SWM0_ANGAN